MRVTVNQPCVFPDLHLFERIMRSDINVNMASAQFSRQGWQSVYHLKVGGAKRNMPVPVRHYGYWVRIDEAEIADEQRWRKKHFGTIGQFYSRAPFYRKYIGDIESLIMDGVYGNIGELAKATMLWGLSCLRIDCVTVNSVEDGLRYRETDHAGTLVWIDDLNVCDRQEGEPSNWVLNLAAAFGADEYYCGGVASSKYLDHEAFACQGIRLVPQDWRCPKYLQVDQAPFIGNLSIIDLLMNVGGEVGKDVILKGDEVLLSATAI